MPVPSRRQWLVLTITVVVVAGVLALLLGNRSPARSGLPGFSRAQVACEDVRAAVRVLEGEYAVMAATVLDHAVRFSSLAAEAHPSWAELDAATRAFHDAAHEQGQATAAEKARAAVAACAEVPVPTSR